VYIKKKKEEKKDRKLLRAIKSDARLKSIKPAQPALEYFP